MKADEFDWQEQSPEHDGDFFYSGKTPSGEEILAIVQITTDPKGVRWCSIFFPAFWRGQLGRTYPEIHFGELYKWKGKWAGPQFGLCCVTSPTRKQ